MPGKSLTINGRPPENPKVGYFEIQDLKNTVRPNAAKAKPHYFSKVYPPITTLVSPPTLPFKQAFFSPSRAPLR